MCLGASLIVLRTPETYEELFVMQLYKSDLLKNICSTYVKDSEKVAIKVIGV